MSSLLAVEVWCSYIVDCMVKFDIVFEDVSFNWNLCPDVYRYSLHYFENSSTSYIICDFVLSNILYRQHLISTSLIPGADPGAGKGRSTNRLSCRGGSRVWKEGGAPC